MGSNVIRENLVEIGTEIFVIWGDLPQMLMTERASCLLDFDRSKPCVSQWRTLRQYRRAVFKTIRNLLERYPGRKGPTLYLKSHLGPKDHPWERFGLSVEGRRGEKERIIRWYCKQVGKEIETRRLGAAGVLRQLKTVLTPCLEAWFARVVLEVPEPEKTSSYKTTKFLETDSVSR